MNDPLINLHKYLEARPDKTSMLKVFRLNTVNYFHKKSSIIDGWLASNYAHIKSNNNQKIQKEKLM